MRATSSSADAAGVDAGGAVWRVVVVVVVYSRSSSSPHSMPGRRSLGVEIACILAGPSALMTMCRIGTFANSNESLRSETSLPGPSALMMMCRLGTFANSNCLGLRAILGRSAERETGPNDMDQSLKAQVESSV